MLNVALDYRFSWRWLVPPVEGTVRFSGFDDTEMRFWLEAYPGLRQLDSPDEPVDLLLWRSSVASESGQLHRWVAGAKVVVVIAESAAVSAWGDYLRANGGSFREYAMLPAHNPRVVVPLSYRHHAVAALALHQPGRRLARWGVGLARLLARLGSYRLLRKRVLLIATRGGDATPQGALQAGLVPGNWRNTGDFALYLGTLDDNRKTVVLPLGAAQPQVLLKVADSDRAREAVRNEAAALTVLSRSQLAHLVPRVLNVVPAHGSIALHQEYRLRVPVRRQVMERAVVSFLAGLSVLDGQWQPLTQVLGRMSLRSGRDLPEDVSTACRALRRRLEEMAGNDMAIWLHRTHGDFAPWNCAWTDRGLFVYDWEESSPEGLALGDAFYFAIAPMLLIRRDPDAAITLEAALQLGRQVMSGCLAGLDPCPYLALWLLPRVHQAPLYGRLAQILANKWR